jgi:hypothetical protein
MLLLIALAHLVCDVGMGIVGAAQKHFLNFQRQYWIAKLVRLVLQM